MKTALRIFFLSAMATLAATAGDLTITYDYAAKGPLWTGGKGVETQFMNANYMKVANEATRTDTLVDYGKGVFYTINHKDKKIQLFTFDDLVAVGDALASRSEAAANVPGFLQGMLGGDDGEVKVEPLGSETILGREAKKYRVTLGKLVNEVSLDPTLKSPINAAAYARFTRLRGNALGLAGGNMRKVYVELSKLKGMALRSRVSGFMGTDSQMVATAVKTTDIPASVFALPAGYATEDQGKKLLKSLKHE